jgi:plasmid maintenance system antidote protein VapI
LPAEQTGADRRPERTQQSDCPGEQLRDDIRKPLGLSADRRAKDIGVPVTRAQATVSA